MKAKVTSVTINPGQPTFQHTLALTANIAGAANGDAGTIALTVTKPGYRQPSTVELVKGWHTKANLGILGIKNTDAVTGLRTAAMKAALTHWASFTPTTDELTAAPIHIGLRIETRSFKGITIHADLTALPFAGYKFWGVCDYLVDADGRLELMTGTGAHRLFTEDPLMVLDPMTHGRKNSWGVIFTKEWGGDYNRRDTVTSEICAQIAAAIMPAVQAMVATTLAEEVSRTHLTAQTNRVEDASKQVMNELWQAAHRLTELRKEQAKLQTLQPDYIPGAQFDSVAALLKELGIVPKDESEEAAD